MTRTIHVAHNNVCMHVQYIHTYVGIGRGIAWEAGRDLPPPILERGALSPKLFFNKMNC